MITVKASNLESIRKDPLTYGRLLAIGETNPGGGSHGMFAYMADVARLVHIGKLTMKTAVTELHSKFLRFKENPYNKARQEKIVEQLVAYLRHYNKRDLEWIDGSRRIQWGITKDVMLTGLTPWVVTDEKGYISYIIAEKYFDWEEQLRFPLYQLYLSNNTIDCTPEEMRVGFYFADKDEFEFRAFNSKHLKITVDETGKIFNTLYSEFKKHKK